MGILAGFRACNENRRDAMKIYRLCVSALLVVLVLAALSLAACGSGDAGNSGNSAGLQSASDQSAPAASDSGGAEDNVAASSESKVTGLESPSAAEGGAATAGRKITFSANFTIDTKKYDADYAKIMQLVSGAGGYIANEESHAYPYETPAVGRNSYLSLRIPVNGYDSFLAEVEKVGEVVDKGKSSEDLTSQYFDTEARIEMLTMRKDRLTEYIKGATKAADIVEFEKELSDVLLELDQYEGEKRRLDQLVDYATVEVYLNEVITPETIGKDGEPLGSRASDAFSLSATGVGRFLQNAAVFLAWLAPILALVAVLLVIAWLIVRLVRRLRAKYYERHPERRTATRQQYMPIGMPATGAGHDADQAGSAGAGSGGAGSGGAGSGGTGSGGAGSVGAGSVGAKPVPGVDSGQSEMSGAMSAAEKPCAAQGDEK
jgi:hypothetical protein